MRDPFDRLMALGMLVERFANLEFFVRLTVEALITDPITRHVVTAQEGVNRLVDLARALNREAMRQEDPRALPDLDDALKLVDAVIRKRNVLFHNTHGASLRGLDETVVWRYRKHNDEPEVTSADYEDLLVLDREVNEAMGALMDARRPPQPEAQ